MGKEADFTKVYGEMIDTFLKHGEEIGRVIYPGASVAGKGQITPTYMRGYGGPGSNIFGLTNRLADGRDIRFVVRYYGDVPKTYKGKVNPWEAGKATYEFLEEAKVDCVPNAYMPNGSRMLFMPWIEGQTLQTAMKGKTLEEQKELLKKVLKPLAKFQYRATAKSEGLDGSREKKIFVGRSEEEKGAEYFAKLIGKVDDNTMRAYKLISSAHQGICVNHGDLGHTNIVLDRNNNVYFIDPELEKGDSYNDLGSLLAYLQLENDLMPCWQEFGEEFWKVKQIVKVEEAGGRVEGSLVPGEEAVKEMSYKLPASAYKKAFKIRAKNKTSLLYPEEQMPRLKKLMRGVLEEWIAHPERTKLTEQDIDAAKILLNNSDVLSLNQDYNGASCTHEPLVAHSP